MASVNVIIVAAGSGLRFGAPLPKQFCNLNGRPVVMTTIEALRSSLPEARLTLVINPDMEDLWLDLCSKHNFQSPEITHGGATRWESVRNAIIKSDEAEIILVHDAVRPMISDKIIKPLMSAITSDNSVDGAIPAVPVTDSLRIVKEDGTSSSIDRNIMRAVQTPQAFKGDRLRKAYSLPYRREFTDDASVMESAGFSHIVLTEGSHDNIKITNPGDIAVAEILIKERTGK